MNHFKISIIIPTFNRENFIEDCLNSILATNDPNFEIIIIDNASTDKTLSKIQKYQKDPRIKIHINKKNKERSYSRNIGLKNSNGKFITLLDSDDKLKKNIFKEFRNFYLNSNNYKIYFSNFEIQDITSNKTKRYNFLKKKCDLGHLSRGNYLSNICVFYHKSIINKVQFDENPNIIGIEDYDFNLRTLYEFGEAKKFSEKFLGIVNDHSQRSVNIDNVSKAENRFLFFKNKIFNHFEYINFSKSIKNSIVSTSSIYVSLICIRNKKKFKSIKYLYISLSYNFRIIMEKRFYYIIFRIIFNL